MGLKIQMSKRGFTLLEIMLAVGILGLMMSVSLISFRAKWQAEQSQRVARQMSILWLKTRSAAWRDGEDWLLRWDGNRRVWESRPVRQWDELEASAEEGAGDKAEPAAVARRFELEVDRRVVFNMEAEPSEGEWMNVRFYANGRADPAAFLFRGQDGQWWRFWTGWDGMPSMEPVRSEDAAARRMRIR
ncbi:MAG: type II secretion system protein [Verrucomicrobiae bacterium]|nr:type II secretion system protein [Verrucomicrobiae bacterium]